MRCTDVSQSREERWTPDAELCVCVERALRTVPSLGTLTHKGCQLLPVGCLTLQSVGSAAFSAGSRRPTQPP
eukprot:m.88588 g.88588  ORF g.88588 m.88588 type:complete len:72 (+) comp19999_c0_seq1:1258-1473(+)